MQFSTGFGWTRLPMLAAVVMLASMTVVRAQIVPMRAAAAPEEAGETADVNDPDVLKGIDVDKLDWSQLNIDATTLNELIAAKKRAHAAASGEPNWSNDRRANGTSAVTVKQSVSLLWDTQVGADMTVAREPTTMSELLAEKALNGGSVPQSSGSAWTTATAPGAGSIWNKTAVEARVDPGAESSKLGASLSKSVPLSDDHSLTLQNDYSVNQQGTSTRNYETDQSVKVIFGETGTGIVAGRTMSTSDDK
jgi:hypothetical protein